MTVLDDMIDRLTGLDKDKKKEFTEEVLNATKDLLWVPTPGPQTVGVRLI